MKLFYKLVKLMRQIKYNQRLPNKIAVLLTNPRSGSTWLFDTLRCHPAIYMHPRSIIYEHLGLVGRRYPRDLSGINQSEIIVEIYKELWERVPNFEVKEWKKFLPLEYIQKSYAIEKFHPDFFNHDVDAFLNRVKKLEKNSTVHFLYQVRDPKSTILSFLRYQKRNPLWYPHINQEQLAQHIRSIYDSILRTAMMRPGLVVDYSQLINNFHMTIERVFDYFWPQKKHTENESVTKLINCMYELTRRDRRMTGGTPFLGNKAGPVSGNNGYYDNFFSIHALEIEYCYQSYLSLLDLNSNRQN